RQSDTDEHQSVGLFPSRGGSDGKNRYHPVGYNRKRSRVRNRNVGSRWRPICRIPLRVLPMRADWWTHGRKALFPNAATGRVCDRYGWRSGYGRNRWRQPPIETNSSLGNGKLPILRASDGVSERADHRLGLRGLPSPGTLREWSADPNSRDHLYFLQVG